MVYSPPYKERAAIIFFLVCSAFSINAQQGGNIFYNLTTANGLSSNRTTTVIQDRQGFYWIGTLDGLNRLDGTSCKVFQHVEQDSTSLSDNNCISLLEDDNGDIWIATLMGLNHYRKDGKFDRFFFNNPRENFEKTNWIWGMTKDSSGNIWVTTRGLWQYNIYTKRWKEWLHSTEDDASIPGGIVNNPVYDKKRNCLWMSGSDGFIQFDIRTEKFYHKKNNPRGIILLDEENYGSPIVIDDNSDIWFYSSSEAKVCKYNVVQNSLENNHIKLWRGIFSMNKDNRNRLWIHFWYGPSYIYDPANNTIDSVFLNGYHSQSPISNHARDLFIDRFGNYWISTWKGVTIFDPDAQALKYYSLDNSPGHPFKESFAITTIAEQNDSILWLGTSEGLYQYNLYQRKLTYRKEQLLKNNLGYVRSLFFQNDSILWVGGWAEVFCYNIRSNKVINYFNSVNLPQSIVKDAEDNIWIGTWRDGMYKFSPSGQLIKQYIKKASSSESLRSNNLVCLGMNSQGNDLWIGYNGGDGFSMVNLPAQQFKHYKISASNEDKFPSNAINCIRQDGRGNLWLGTFGRGLICFDPSNESYKTIMQSDGLKGNFINAILTDDSSRLWISTTNGINILDTKNDDIIQTNIDLSFAGNDFLANGFVRKNKKFMFFAGSKIVEVDPNTYYRAVNSYEILLSSFKIFDKEKYLSAFDRTVKLTYRQNFFSLDYSLLKPNPNSFTQYAYQLKGFDKDWNYVRERRTAYYTNVPPGQYDFLVKASDENGKWIYFSKPLEITIKPPFWQQWWFIAAAVILITTSLYLFYFYRIDQLKKILAIRTKISQDLHDEVASTLSGIRLYSEMAKQQLQNQNTEGTQRSLNVISSNANDMAQDMSDIIWAINPLNDSFKKLLQKLKGYATEISIAANMKFDCTITDQIPEERLTMQQRRNVYLICKEAINNAVKYSLAKNLMMVVERANHAVTIKIQDDGSGFDKTNGSPGNGLVNMKERAKEINAGLEINSYNHGGTVIELTVKL